jgi:hypothetical protein
MRAKELQIAIYQHLNDRSPYTLVCDFPNIYSQSAAQVEAFDTLEERIGGRIHDNPLQVPDPENGSAFPCITIGESYMVPWDTDTEKGVEARLMIHVWSRASHHLECKAIQDAVSEIFHRDTIAIGGFVGCDLLQQSALRDPDGVTIHGVQEFRIIFDEV